MDLIPTSQNGSNFVQQGTVDWTALTQTTFSASLAILGRLSSAGLEPLTVAMAQALCLQIPIGVHGEQKLQESIDSLKCFSSFGDLVWFGVGVRHILRTLVQSSQGASSVALAASLTESYSLQFSAKVFYGMAKCMKSPSELTPSFGQWESYVKVCSGLFSGSIFGHKVGQLARLLSCSTPIHLTARLKDKVPDPDQLAELLYQIGKVQRKHWESIDIIGSRGCCWIAVFCDFLLGLRIQISSQTGNIVFQNYDSGSLSVQVRIRYTESLSGTSLTFTGHSFTLNPRAFLDGWRNDGHPMGSDMSTNRVNLNVIKKECFENLFDGVHVGPLARILAVCSAVYHDYRKWDRCQPTETFIVRITELMPELRPLYRPAVSALNHTRDTLGSGIEGKQPVPDLDSV